MKRRALTTKLIRDLLHLRAPLIAIAIVMACGVGGLVMTRTTSESLRASLDAYYDRYRFADLFLSLKRAPEAIRPEIAAVPGVAHLETRVSVGVTLDVPGVIEPAVGRIISIPDDRQPSLHRLFLRNGRLPDPDRHGEVVVSEAFAEALGIGPGDTIGAVINGTRETLRITGTALSPEFVYAIQPGGFVPDDKRFAVFWMPHRQLAPLYDMEGAFNDLIVKLSPGAREQAVIDGIDALLDPYGGTGAYARDEQISHLFISDELAQLRTMGTVMPSVFLFVSALLVNIVLARLIRTQREQIAVLRSFGYTRLQIGSHYLAMAVVVAVVGALLGLVFGAVLGKFMLALYVKFYRFPIVLFEFGASAAAVAIAATTAAAVLGAIHAVGGAMRLPPAEAMRPEPPGRYHASFIDRIGLLRRLSPSTKMFLRHVERRPLRAMVSIVGMSLSISILTMGTYVSDAIDYLIEYQFVSTQRYDLSLGFTEPRAGASVFEVAALPGVIDAEPFRTVPVRIHHNHLSERQSIVGVQRAAMLERIIDDRGDPIVVPPTGLVLTESLASQLKAGPGDTVTVEVLEGQRPVVECRVEALARTYIGAAAYMSIEALHGIMREGDVASGVHLTFDSAETAPLYRRIKDTPQIASTTVKRASLDSFEETLAESILIMRSFNLAFACVIAVGVVYNSTRIALAERARELATLRVLGMYKGEIAAIFYGELALLMLMAIPIGLTCGYYFARTMSALMSTETHRIPFMLTPQTMAFALAVVLAAAIVTALDTRRQLDDLDLIAVLKDAS
ncbi:MAG: FtsX-like permease family protein [Phycisphaerales bacterium]|nr:ABC transporter permease [Phycisphaerales bacterium]